MTLLVPFILFLVPLILLGFVAMWVFVVWLIGLLSGWQTLAAKYRTTQSPMGQTWPGQYGFVNNSRYGNALNVTTNALGFFLEPIQIFNINHPRLFIPWGDLHSPTEWVFRNRSLIRVRVGQPAMASISLPDIIFEETEGRHVLEQAQIGTNVPA